MRGVAGFLDAELVTLTDEQRRALDAGLADMRRDALASGGATPADAGLEDLFETETAVGGIAGQNHVAYSAGAVAVLFLFFSTVHGALSLHDERASGVVDRALAGPGGLRPLVLGKLAFLSVQGFAQVGLLFAAAWVVHGVDLPGRFAGFALVTAAASAAAAALALVLVAACRTRRQAQTIANVAILVRSAVGGSMVPRFFMPPLLQRVGWLPPTTWAVEAYAGVFWRGDGLAALAVPVGLLAAAAALATAAALALTARWERV
jgi:ABC-2 type transport system permease protein